MEDLKKENLMLKIALCKMLEQFMYRRTIRGVEFYDDYCESAGEWAFRSLGFKEKLVMVHAVEALEEQSGEELLALNKSKR